MVGTDHAGAVPRRGQNTVWRAKPLQRGAGAGGPKTLKNKRLLSLGPCMVGTDHAGDGVSKIKENIVIKGVK